MRVKTMLLTAAAFTVLMSSAAFAGTWKAGADANQGKWWYDNGDGTYAANGWQWIDDNGDGVAECYYFDADGWMYADTTTPDGYQVNASGAWMENGEVKTSVAAAAPAVGWFEAAGLQVNAQQNVVYDLVTSCKDYPELKTTGKLVFYDYQTIESDAFHPAKEGYVWKMVSVDIVYGDDIARLYGARHACGFLSRDALDTQAGWDGRACRFTLNVCGTDYTECEKTWDGAFNGWDENDTQTYHAQASCLVPAGYDGMIVAVFDDVPYDGEDGLINVLRNAWIFALD